MTVNRSREPGRFGKPVVTGSLSGRPRRLRVMRIRGRAVAALLRTTRQTRPGSRYSHREAVRPSVSLLRGDRRVMRPQPPAARPKYRFSFGPWNISTGADPFGPPVRKEMEYARKLKAYKELGFDAVQFHDDDIVPADLDWPSTLKGVAEVKKILDGEGLFVEIIAPRLWEDPRTIDGALHLQQPGRPQVRPRPRQAVRRHRPRGRLQELRPLAGPRGHVHPRGQGRQDRRRAGSSTPGTRSSSTTRRSASSARPSPTSRWTRPTCRPSAT